jgi:hypothetical protein
LLDNGNCLSGSIKIFSFSWANSFAKEDKPSGCLPLRCEAGFVAGIESGVKRPIKGVLKWKWIAHPKMFFVDSIKIQGVSGLQCREVIDRAAQTYHRPPNDKVSNSHYQPPAPQFFMVSTQCLFDKSLILSSFPGYQVVIATFCAFVAGR